MQHIRIQRENHESNENLRIPIENYENYENHENLRILNENNKNHANVRIT